MNKIRIYTVGLIALAQPALATNLPAQFSTQTAALQPIQQSSPNSTLHTTLHSVPYSRSDSNSADLGVQFDLSDSEPIPTRIFTPDSLQIDSHNLPNGNPSAQPASPPPLNLLEQASFTLRQLFSKDSDSLVAVAVGNAEGTRTPEGDHSTHFYGHTDPGNGVWNLGTFSYQHGASSVEEADAKQLARLKRQAAVMQEKAGAKGLKLTLEETLNGIDLANQAPEALLDVAGYIDWLAQAQSLGMSGSEAILWARVQSFIDPKTQRWNAPGLGNTAESITRDQRRRMQAIARAIERQNNSIAADARLNPQPIGFRLPRWNLAQRLLNQMSSWLNWA